MKLSRIVLSIALLSSLPLQAGVVNVGSGSYTTDHPGYDQAGRNKVPAGTPQLSGDAVGHPVPTNDWWSNVLYKDQSENILHIPWACAHVPTDSHSPIFQRGRWSTSAPCISALATSHRQNHRV